MSDSPQPAPIKFRIRHLLHGSRMLLPLVAMLIGLSLVFQTQDSTAQVAGVALMVGGVAITLSVVGAPIGIPLASLGFLLLIRALF